MAERLEEDTLYLAATRPALFAGVPLPVAGAFLMLAGFVIVILQNPLYEMAMLPLWFGARLVVSRAWFGIGGFGVTRTRRNGRLLDPDGGWQVIFRGRPGGPRGSRVLGLRRAEAQQFEPMRMAFAGQQFTRTTSGSLRALAAHETPVVQEEP